MPDLLIQYLVLFTLAIGAISLLHAAHADGKLVKVWEALGLWDASECSGCEAGAHEPDRTGRCTCCHKRQNA